MPKIAPETPKSTFVFKGHKVEVPQPFTVGMTVDENLARFLNRQLTSVTGNALSSAITRKVGALQSANDAKPEAERRKEPFTEKDLTAEDVQSTFNAIFEAYEPGVTQRGGGASEAHDPVESIARNIAWERVRAILTKNGFRIPTKREDKDRLTGQMLDKDPTIRTQAKTQFEGSNPLEMDDSMFAGLEKKTTPAVEAAPATVPTDGGPAAPDTPASPTPTEGEAAGNAGLVANPDTAPADGTVDTRTENTGAAPEAEVTPAEAPAASDAPKGAFA